MVSLYYTPFDLKNVGHPGCGAEGVAAEDAERLFKTLTPTRVSMHVCIKTSSMGIPAHDYSIRMRMCV